MRHCEITKEDANRCNHPDTEAVALAGEWKFGRLRAYFSLFCGEAIAGEGGVRDHEYTDFADTNSAFKKAVCIRLLDALRAGKCRKGNMFSCAVFVNIL